MQKFAQDLTPGNLIDLTPAIIKFCPEIDPETDVSAYEYAVVETVENKGSHVIVYTNLHNISVFPHFEFEGLES